MFILELIILSTLLLGCYWVYERFKPWSERPMSNSELVEYYISQDTTGEETEQVEEAEETTEPKDVPLIADALTED